MWLNALRHACLFALCLCPGMALAEANVLQLYTYPAYFPPQVLQQFKKETGIHVNVAIIEGDNDALYAKLNSLPTPTYDLTTLANYSLKKFQQAGLMDHLDPHQIPNAKHLSKHLMRLINPNPASLNALPFVWGTTGMLVNTRYHNLATHRTWASLWHAQLKNQLLLSSDMRDVIGMALITLHQSPSTHNPHIFAQAIQKLTVLRPNIRLFASNNLINLYVDEDITLGMCWSGEAYLAQQANPHLQYVYPEEGFGLWVDTLVLVHDAPHPKAAYAFMNFISRPDIAKQILMREGVMVANQGMLKLLPPAMRQNPIINPSPEVMRRAILYRGLGDAESMYRSAWHRLKWSMALR